MHKISDPVLFFLGGGGQKENCPLCKIAPVKTTVYITAVTGGFFVIIKFKALIMEDKNYFTLIISLSSQYTTTTKSIVL